MIHLPYSMNLRNSLKRWANPKNESMLTLNSSEPTFNPIKSMKSKIVLNNSTRRNLMKSKFRWKKLKKAAFMKFSIQKILYAKSMMVYAMPENINSSLTLSNSSQCMLFNVTSLFLCVPTRQQVKLLLPSMQLPHV